jgi:hypothetical protein
MRSTMRCRARLLIRVFDVSGTFTLSELDEASKQRTS